MLLSLLVLAQAMACKPGVQESLAYPVKTGEVWRIYELE